MVKRLIAVMLMALLIAAVASVPGVAEADEPEEPDYTDPNVIVEMLNELMEADDPDAAFLELSPETQRAIIDAFRTAPIESTVIHLSGGASAATDDPGDPNETEKCDTHTVKVTKRLAGIKNIHIRILHSLVLQRLENH